MRVAIISEAETDEAVVRILAEGVLGHRLRVVHPPIRRRAGGWTTVVPTLVATIRHAYFQRTDIDGVIAVMDSDDAPFEPANSPLSRLTSMHEASDPLLRQLDRRDLRPPLRVALGLAVPALEAWLRGGVDPQVNEASWARQLDGVDVGYDRVSLKKAVYGSSRRIARDIAERVAARLASDIGALEEQFPIGFGSLAGDLRGW